MTKLHEINHQIKFIHLPQEWYKRPICITIPDYESIVIGFTLKAFLIHKKTSKSHYIASIKAKTNNYSIVVEVEGRIQVMTRNE